MDFMVAARRDEEDALVEGKCRYEKLRWIADEPAGQTGRSVMGNENLYAVFTAKTYGEYIQTSHSLSTIASSLLPVCNEG